MWGNFDLHAPMLRDSVPSLTSMSRGTTPQGTTRAYPYSCLTPQQKQQKQNKQLKNLPPAMKPNLNQENHAKTWRVDLFIIIIVIIGVLC